MKRWKVGYFVSSVCALLLPMVALARDVEYTGAEDDVYVSPGEPTQLQFPSKISGGFKKKDSSLVLDRRDSDLVVFARGPISETGEALIVRLEDGRSYAIRARRANDDKPRDTFVRLQDGRGVSIVEDDEEDPRYKEKRYPQSPPTQVAGLMREMVLVSEFGKSNVTGYRQSDKYKGQTVLSDGAVRATIDRIFIGSNLWGYVLDVENMLDQSQKLNPATFRLDGTRAVVLQQGELAGRPLNAEQQIAGKDRAKVYIVTRARK